ncbi:MAG: cupin domain-containing protein [Thermoplasmata archaeon]
MSKHKKGSMDEVWFGKTKKATRPSAVRLADTTTVVFDDGIATSFISSDVWDLGLYFMEPGMDTIVFSLEQKDDGTADEWYGPSHEFYYILSGEFTISYDTDAQRLKKRKSPNYVVRPGDAFAFPPGWKYQVRCSSDIPGSFFWGKSAPPKGVKERLIPPVRTL